MCRLDGCGAAVRPQVLLWEDIMVTRLARLTILAALLCAPLSAFGALGFNTAVTYYGSDGTRRIHNFAIGSNGLVENYFNGSTWQWISHPAPSDEFAALFSARAITYVEDGLQRIYVFAITGNGHDFVVRYWNGVQWQWAKLPTASFLRREKIDAITYLDELGKRRIYLFGVDDNTQARMITTWWDGSTWQTTSFESPGRSRVDGQPTAVTYADNGIRRIHVYCTVNEFGSVQPKLHSLTWNGNSWAWINLTAQHFRPRSAITYLDANNMRRIQVFGARELNDSLAVYEWNGSSWSLSDLGKPEFHDYGPPDASAITYTSNSGGRPIFVATTFNDHLYFKRQDGPNWSTYGSFAGNAMQFADDPAWTHYVDPRSGNDILNLFVSSADGLMRHRWNGVSWTSFDNGSP